MPEGLKQVDQNVAISVAGDHKNVGAVEGISGDQCLSKILGGGNSWDQFDFKVVTPNDRGGGISDTSNPHWPETTNISESPKEEFEKFSGTVRTREYDPSVSGNTRKSFCYQISFFGRKYLN